jgi:DNA excision repair protein ERCC-3
MTLKSDHQLRPLWVTTDKRLFLEKNSSICQQAFDFILTIAEPLHRTKSFHEYRITSNSLCSGISNGFSTNIIILGVKE